MNWILAMTFCLDCSPIYQYACHSSRWNHTGNSLSSVEELLQTNVVPLSIPWCYFFASSSRTKIRLPGYVTWMSLNEFFQIEGLLSELLISSNNHVGLPDLRTFGNPRATIYFYLSLPWIMKWWCISILREESTENRGLPSEDVDRQWGDSNLQPSRPKATTLFACLPPAKNFKTTFVFGYLVSEHKIPIQLFYEQGTTNCLPSSLDQIDLILLYFGIKYQEPTSAQRAHTDQPVIEQNWTT